MKPIRGSFLSGVFTLLCITVLTAEPIFADEIHDQILDTVQRIESLLNACPCSSSSAPQGQAGDHDNPDVSFAQDDAVPNSSQAPSSQDAATDVPVDDTNTQDVDQLTDPNLTTVINDDAQPDEPASPEQGAEDAPISDELSGSNATQDIESDVQTALDAKLNQGDARPSDGQNKQNKNKGGKGKGPHHGKNKNVNTNFNAVARSAATDLHRRSLEMRIMDLEQQLMRTMPNQRLNADLNNNAAGLHARRSYRRRGNFNKNGNLNVFGTSDVPSRRGYHYRA